MTLAVAVACATQPQVHLRGTTPPAGHESAINAVAGFYRSMLVGNPMVTCSYVDPGEEGNCLNSLGTVGAATGSWRIDRSVVSGARAIVAAEQGNLCLDNQCVTATHGDDGLPHGRTSFNSAWLLTQNMEQGKPHVGAIGCIRIEGKWYVELPVNFS